MISFALGELQAPSLHYIYYEMTWAEFRIRSFSFMRMEKRDEYKRRELIWNIYTAPHRDPKTMKKTIGAFWPIEKDNKGPGPTEKMIQAFKEAQIKYLEEKKKKENG